MKLEKQQLLIIALSLVVIGGFGIFRYVPLVRQSGALEARINESKHLHEQASVQSVVLPELRQRKDELQEALALFTERVPARRNFAQFWQQIADVMDACDLTEQLVEPGEELKSEQLCSIPLTLECQGTLDQLFAFFKALENTDRLVRIEEVVLEHNNAFDAVVKLNAKANVYYQSDDAGES